MKAVRLLIAVLALVLCASAAFANSNTDPTIIVKDPVCPTSCQSVGTSFSFGTPASGLGTLLFHNASGVNWVNLKLTEIGVPAGLITCLSPGAFASCNVSTVNGVTTIFLSGVGGNNLGIPMNHNFSITFGCGNIATSNCDAWPGDLDFTAKANVPEPASMVLFLTGLAGIATRRKWFQRA